MSPLILALGMTALSASGPEVEVRTEAYQPLELGVVGGAFLPGLAGPATDMPLRPVGIDFALRFAVRPAQMWAFELELGHVALRGQEGSELSAYTMGGQVLLQWPALFTPFLLAGGGAMGLPKSGDDAVGAPVPSLHWGAGLKYLLGREVAARAEGRHVVGFDGRHHGELLLSVAFLFGSSEEQAP